MRYPKDIKQVTVKHYQVWLNTQERKLGKRAHLTYGDMNAVEMFVQDVYGKHAVLFCGEIEVDGKMFFTDFNTTGYYQYSASNSARLVSKMHTRLKVWKLLATSENTNARLIVEG